MTDRLPTDILEQEHRFIEKVVEAMPALIKELEAGQEIDAGLLQDTVEFMRTFADRCHHGKEEAHLFPVLVSRGVPDTGCPIGGLTAEHQQGRALVKELGPDDQQALLAKFAQVEAEIGQDTHRRFEQMARDLAALVSQSDQKLN